MSEEFLHALPRGTRLGEYEIESVLGHGGFGITYLGRDSILGLYLAIKEYMPSDLCVRMEGGEVRPKSESVVEDFDWGLDRFVDEAKLLALFSHPNIVPVQRYFTSNGTAYLVMPFQDGESLGDLIFREDTLSPEKLKSIVVPVLHGLEEVHKADFMHRDIKPDNIFLRNDGTPMLLDFGAARQALGGKTRAITAVATPGFAPMEQYYADGNQGPWTDIYAMACVMYRAIGGRMPPEAPARIESDPLVPLADLAGPEWDPEFLKSIERAMSPRTSDRPQDVGTWLAELYGTPTIAMRPAPAAPAPAPAPADAGKTIVDPGSRSGAEDAGAGGGATILGARSGPAAGQARTAPPEANQAPPGRSSPDGRDRRPRPPAKADADPGAGRGPSRKKKGGIPPIAFAAAGLVVAVVLAGIVAASMGMFSSGSGGGTAGGGETGAEASAGTDGATGGAPGTAGGSEIGDGGTAGGSAGETGSGGASDGWGGETGGGSGGSAGTTGGPDEAAIKAEAEAKAKAEAEAKAKAKAEAEARAKAAAEARRKAEAKRKAEEEARIKAEQEARAAAAPQIGGATVYRFFSTRMPTVKQAYTITLGGGGALIGKYDYIGGPGGAAPGDPDSDRGTWSVSGDKLCTKWSKWEGGRQICYTLKKSGESVSASGGGLMAGKIK